MLSVKEGSIKYHFLSLWYDSIWNWTQVSRAIGKHSNHYANVRFYVCVCVCVCVCGEKLKNKVIQSE